MQEVFVVTSGCYSEYSIHAIFSTRELAQEWIDKQKDPTDCSIEPYTLDAQVGAQLLTAWEVFIRDDGYLSSYVDKSTKMAIPYRGRVEYYVPSAIRATSTISEAHARKVAVEARQAQLRHEAFEPDDVE